MKNVFLVSNATLKADIAIVYYTHKNCRFGNAVPCSLLLYWRHKTAWRLCVCWCMCMCVCW